MIEIKINTASTTPYEIGFKRGKRLKELRPVIDHILEILIPFKSELERRQTVQKAMRLSTVIKQKLPEMFAEIEGIVEGAQWNIEEYSLYHHWAYLTKEEIQCCTNIFASENRTETGEPILARNKDQPGVFRNCQEITNVYNPEGLSFVCLRNAGWLGCDQGIYEAGFGFALSSAHSGRYSLGIQAYVLGTVLLAHAKNLVEALKILVGVDHAGEASYLMADAEGNAAVFESGYNNCYSIRRPNNGTLISTNHYQSDSMKKLTARLKSSKLRYERINELLNRKDRFGVDDIINSLMDHNHPDSFCCVCRHDERMPTLATSIIFPNKNRMSVQFGNPCERQGFHSWVCTAK